MNSLIFFSRTNVIFFSVLWLTAAVGIFLVPLDTIVPIIWNPLVGEPFVSGPIWLVLLLMPALGLLFTTFFAIKIQTITKKEFESASHFIHAVINSLLFVLLILTCTFIFIGRGGEIYYPKIAAIAVGGSLVVLGNFLPKSQPNKIIGIALPCTLSDPNIWRFTHRWTGRLTLITGFVLIILVLTVLEGPGIFAGVFSAITVPLLSGIILSYIADRMSNNKNLP